MNERQRAGPPADLDPREFTLQLAVVADRLDERSAQAVGRLEAACTAVEREAGAAARALAAERGQVATARQAAEAARLRLLWITSIALLVGALVAVAGAALAVASAERELDAIQRNQSLLHAINGADVTLCGDRLCARFETSGQPMHAEKGGYRPIARRNP